MKKTTHDLTEPPDKQHYKKRYLVRKLQEQEAEAEIKNHRMEDDEDCTPIRRAD